MEKDMPIDLKTIDYYEFLQISPNADPETIHRVYRFLGARFHPDNPESGNAETFATLKTAYEVLSDPDRRSEYDATFKREPPRRVPLSQSIDFMDSVEGETNRRLALLAVLYFQRRLNPSAPQISLAEIERRMGFPRDYLDFTTWYLQQKKYIIAADNSDFTLTVQGVDYVETERAHIPVLNKLLTSGSRASSADHREETKVFNPTTNGHTDNSASNGFHPHPEPAPPVERRVNAKERRVNAPDNRVNPVERRTSAPDRRSNNRDRQVNTADRRTKN
jgi:curved DNA-binding protein CbpA